MKEWRYFQDKYPETDNIHVDTQQTPYGPKGTLYIVDIKINSKIKKGLLSEDRIERATGASVADPWKPYHAITATALYLSDLGAVAGNEASERNAACKYYSGRSCSSSSAGAGYGNSVMRKLYSMQQDIDKLQK